MSIPNYIPVGRRAEVGRRWAQARAAKRMERGPDAETLRRRALHDARGQVLRQGCTYRASGETHWQIVRSVHGRINQRDILLNGQVFKTCGPRRLPAWLR